LFSGCHLNRRNLLAVAKVDRPWITSITDPASKKPMNNLGGPLVTMMANTATQATAAAIAP